MFAKVGFFKEDSDCAKKGPTQYDDEVLILHTDCKQTPQFEKCRRRRERDRCGESRRIVSTAAEGKTRRGAAREGNETETEER